MKIRPLLPAVIIVALVSVTACGLSGEDAFTTYTVKTPVAIPADTPLPTDTRIAADTPTPTSAPDTGVIGLGRILFIPDDSNKDTGLAAALHADGSDLTRLFYGEAWPTRVWSPTWSPNGNEVAFVGYTKGSPDLYVTDVAGTGPRRLTWDAGVLRALTWSPDGLRIAFGSDRLANIGDWGSIYVVNADGSNLQRLTSGDEEARDPAWRPDGTQIAFIDTIYEDPEDAPFLDYHAIFAMAPDGSDAVQLTDFETTEIADLAWSPDGELIAFECPVERSDFHIVSTLCIIEADGSNRRQIPSQVETNPCLTMTDPTWSPDGRLIAFTCGVSVDSTYIATMNVAGSGVVLLTEGYEPDWEPLQ